MNLFNNVKITKKKLNQLTKLLTVSQYHVVFDYTDELLTIGIHRNNEKHEVVLNLKDSGSNEYYTYKSSKLTTPFMNNTVNKHLGLNLTFDVKNHKSSINNSDDTYWATFQLDYKTKLFGIAKEEGDKLMFCPVDYINSGKDFYPVSKFKVTSVEDRIEPETINDMIDFALDMNDKERFHELLEMKKAMECVEVN